MSTAAHEVIVRRSPHDFRRTVERLTEEIAAHGAEVFAVIDHASNAHRVGLSMPPTVVVLFGDPAVGTPPMLVAPDLALDLPSRVLVRQAGDAVEVAYTTAAAVVARHGLSLDDAAGLSGLVRVVNDALAS